MKKRFNELLKKITNNIKYKYHIYFYFYLITSNIKWKTDCIMKMNTKTKFEKTDHQMLPGSGEIDNFYIFFIVQNVVF